MKTLLLTIFLSIYINFCFSQKDTTFFDKDWKKCVRTEAHFFRVIKKDGDNYLVKDMYINNRPQMIAICSSIEEPLIKNGKCTFYDENGIITSQGSYSNNKQVGLWMKLKNNGQDTTLVEYSLNGDFNYIKSTNKNNVVTTLNLSKTHTTTIPFIEKENKLYIDVYFGKNKIKKVLVFDTDAPFSADESITNDTSFSKIINGKTSKINTVNGKKSTVNHYVANEISIGDISFNQVEMWEHQNNNLNNGLFGSNVLKTGIWQINFVKHTLTFADNIELIKDLKSYIKIPIHINEKNQIMVDLNFDEIIIKDIAVDFGFNLTVALSKVDFDLIDSNHKAIVATGSSNSSNDKVRTNFYTLKNKKYLIGNTEFKTDIFSNDINRKNLIGVAFFKQFDILILDYKNRNLYIKK
ncbi:MAG: hypothetical protein A3F72_13020 [Bacteroidetes bacterium RIFCSPLOWO2_12_FULL_35_15]|nr:MAG: hypothetical protein A3F72_13020 [Bacteroidetes bacterium RIFCSPLOWO2_12_FULL_35_15]